ncbi:MAG: toll/interleukin-1 receptor domain-containing protein, partial [Rhodanobacter sp.]
MTQGLVSPAFPYYAFISYSHQDKAWADWLHKALETYAVPKRLVGQTTAAGVIPKRLTPIFRDREDLASAHDLGGKINEALGQSANLIVICSPHSAASPWVQGEILAYKRLGHGERIFCLIVDGEPHASGLPGREAEECFAAALRFELDANDQPTLQRAEPIAADGRSGKDGKSNAKLKLIAGMLGVGFDALKQRELRRRARRMTAIAALALIVTIATSVLAITALLSRRDAVLAQHKAVIAQKVAVVAQEAAERRQKQAEGLVGFMLGDLNDKLNQVGRLSIMQAVDDKALAYFESMTTTDATDSALALRVSALQKIASVRMDQGRIPPALQAYQAAASLAAELTRRAPGDVALEGTYGDSLKWVGQAYWYQGDLDKALKNFQLASTLLEKAHRAKPGDDDLAFKLATAHNDAGHVREARGDFDAARQDYAVYLQIFEALHQREPANAKWLPYLGSAWNNLGKVESERGHLDQAVANYRADQQIKASIVAHDPADHDAEEQLLVSNAILGRALALCGDNKAALRYTQAAVDSA